MSAPTERDPVTVVPALTALSAALASPVAGPGLLAAATAVDALLVAARTAAPRATADRRDDEGTADECTDDETLVAAGEHDVLVSTPELTLVSRRLADGTTTTQVSIGGLDWTVDGTAAGDRRIRVREGYGVVADWSFGPTGATDNRDLDAQLARFEETARQALETMVPPEDLDQVPGPRVGSTPAPTPDATERTVPGSGAIVGATLVGGALAAVRSRAGATSTPDDGIASDAAAAAPSGPWTPTHDVPVPLPAWSDPDPALAPVATLDAGVEVRVVAQRGDWAQVEAWNGWRGWVDARQLAPRT